MLLVLSQLYSGAAGNSNYLIKQLAGTTASSLAFGYGPCLNEWRVAIPTVSSAINTFTTRVGFGDNPTGRPTTAFISHTMNKQRQTTGS